MAALLQRLATAAGLATLLASPAFAQNTSTVLNGQLQWGDVVSTMNVVSRNGSPQVSSVATSAGNTVSGANLSGDLDAESEQTMSGASFATVRAFWSIWPVRRKSLNALVSRASSA